MQFFWIKLLRQYRNTPKCVSSKAALLTLLWVFVIYLIYIFSYQPANYISNFTHSPIDILVAIYAVNAVVLCLFPVAGFLADNKFGRYRTVTKSLYLLIVSLLLALPLLLPLPILDHLNDSLKVPIAITLLAVASVPILLLTVSFIGLVANVVQFGMDQLHDSPAAHQSLFLYWFLWVYYLAFFTSQILWNSFFDNLENQTATFTALALILLLPIAGAMFILTVSLCIASRHPQWFLMDSAKFNPYKLVYQVSKFAQHHKVPIHRSAFTYCEDNIPKGLDLGKSKYGGPFTTEEVEDVKVFFGILKVLFVLALTHFLNVAVDPLLFYYASHVSDYYNETTEKITIQNDEAKKLLLQDGLLSSIMCIIGIPVYLWLVQPFILSCLPGMLKRIGLGILVRIISLICTLVMDTASHLKGFTDTCMFKYPHDFVLQDISPLTVQRTLFAFSNIVIYTALNEFICSQSPYSMKGLLLGLSFAIRGVSELIAVALIIPFSYIPDTLPSCGMYYYIMTIIVSIVAFASYSFVAKSYQYRKRDEICNYYQYAEEYYSNTQDDNSNYIEI